jgi:hypothetical protein
MNTERRSPDRGGKVFIPESIDVGYDKEGFFSMTKLIVFIVTTILMVIGFRYMWKLPTSFLVRIPLALGVVWVWQYIVRVYILQEKYYLKVYREIRKSPIVPANRLWYIGDLSVFNEITYARFPNMKVAVFVRVERGTIAGREASYTEEHYDAISDFYRNINEAGYELHQINLMESAGKDSRLGYLDQLVLDCKEVEPLKDYLQSATEHIKKKSANTLVSRDYYILYADKDSLVNLTEGVGFIFEQLMRGAYHSYSVLDEDGIYEFVRECLGVDTFNRELALNSTVRYTEVARILDIIYEDGEVEAVAVPIKVKSNPNISKRK